MLNIEKIDQVKDLLGDRFDDLYSDYKEDAEKYIQAIEQGISEKDPEQVHLSAHPLKSSSYNIGFQQLGEIAEKVEMEAKGATEAPEKLDALSGIEGQLRQSLTESMQALKSL